MADHVFEIAVTLVVTGAEEPTPEPIGHVVAAVKQLLEESDWLLEAIGHPHPEGFEVIAEEG